jgi:hypothetical protein
MRAGARFCPACGTAIASPRSTVDAKDRRRGPRFDRRLALLGITALFLVAATLGVLLATGVLVGGSPAGGTAGEVVSTPVNDGTGQSPISESVDRPCDKTEAERQMAEGELADLMRREFDSSVDPGDSFYTQLVACADLDGDSVNEMVVQGLPPAAGGPTPWAILTPEKDGWTPVFTHLLIPVSSLTVEDDTVREVSAGYAPEDALCCPTYERSGTVSWNGDSFEYVPDEGSPERDIVIASDGRPTGLGELDLATGNLGAAKALWGPPTNVSADGSTVCHARWADLGLRITFANFGGAGACGQGGRVSSVDLAGQEAAQAGWEIPGGFAVGDPLEEMLAAYPNAPRGEYQSTEDEGCSGTPYVLRTMPFIGEETPSLQAYPDRDLVQCIRLSPYSAGE